MNKNDYQKGQLVWAKIKGFPWWPAIIARIYNDEFDPEGRTDFLVNFIGDNSHAKLAKDKVWDFEEKFKEYAKQTKSKKLINSIKIANLIKNGLTTYEEEMNKLKQEKKRKFRPSSDSSSASSSPSPLPRKKRKSLGISDSRPSDFASKAANVRSSPFEGENLLSVDLPPEGSSTTNNKLQGTDFENFSKETNFTDDNLDYLLFSGEFERISRSKAKELNIEHKLTAPLQLENKGVLKKTTQKIREKFMKKTNSFKSNALKPRRPKEKAEKQQDLENSEDMGLEALMVELNENFWEIERNSKKNNRNNYIFRKLDAFMNGFEAKGELEGENDVLALSKLGKMFKTIIFILKRLEEKKDIYDLKSLKPVIEKAGKFLRKIKKTIIKKSLDIDEFLQKNNYSSLERENSKLTEEDSFPDSEKSLNSPNQVFFSTKNTDKNQKNALLLTDNIFLPSPENGKISDFPNNVEFQGQGLINSGEQSKILKPLLRKKICLKLAKMFETTFGIEKGKAQQLSLQLEGKLRFKFPGMDSAYKEKIKNFIGFIRLQNKAQLTAEDLKAAIKTFDEYGKNCLSK